jgi:sec-independent protein translocase protein TatA
MGPVAGVVANVPLISPFEDVGKESTTMGRIGATELLVLLVVCLLLWGPTRLPELGRSLGRSIAEFRRGMRGEEPVEPPPTPPAGGSSKP